MNKGNILKLAEYMENLRPEEYDQRYSEHPRGPHCGTPACIAGHAAWLAGQWSYEGTIEDAKEWLGITWDHANGLFDSAPYVGEDLTPTPQDAARTLRHLAETGEVDWWRAKQ